VYKQPIAFFNTIKSWFGSSSQEKETKQPDYLEPKGLQNFGTTCYFNSMIQALSTSKFFREQLVSGEGDMGEIRGTLRLLFEWMNREIDKEYESDLETHVQNEYKEMVRTCEPTFGRTRPPDLVLEQLERVHNVPSAWLPRVRSLDHNGEILFQPTADEVAGAPEQPGTYSYLYNWSRLGDYNGEYNESPIKFAAKIEDYTPEKIASEKGMLSKDFKLKCIICYDNDRHHYYVVKEHRKNWFEISDNEVKLAVECERKNEETIITELNEKYDKKILMAFYDYDPEYKIGV